MTRPILQQPNIQVNDFWESNAQNNVLLIELVGEDTALTIENSNVKCKQGQDKVIWKPIRDETFSTTSAQEMTWDKEEV